MKFNKKYFATVTAISMVSLMALTSCSKGNNEPAATQTPAATEAPATEAPATEAPETTTATLNDGTYTTKADAADDKGFTYQMTMEVKDGKITSLVYDAINADGKSKAEMSLNGEYTMTEDGLPWAEQAEALANYVIENQGISSLEVKEDGKTDAISGVSISVGGFVEYAEKLMKEAAGQQTVSLKDGSYTTKADAADDKGFTYQMNMEVKDGKITSLVYDAINADGKSKAEMSLNGEYTMTEDGLPWAEQAEALANYVIENQAISSLEVKEDGKTDAISGVSISVGGFVEFAEKLMKEAAGQQTVSLKDGSYEKKADAADDKGFTYQMNMEVKDGKITSLVYDAINADGKSKAEMSLNGEYTMTEDGLAWAEQAEALANYVIENQAISSLEVKEDGKTDAISGVSISVGGFVEFAEALLQEAAQ